MHQDKFSKNWNQTSQETEAIQDNIAEVKSNMTKVGIVTGCSKLNVREEPKTDSAIISEISCQAEVMIEETESTEDFYKVCTSFGVEGFCMKKYIVVKS